MRYQPITKDLFTSQSGHHGYLNIEPNAFELNDYSMKGVRFVRLTSGREQ